MIESWLENQTNFWLTRKKEIPKLWILHLHRVKMKERWNWTKMKLDKYLDLVRGLKKLRNMKVTILSIIARALEKISEKPEKRLDELETREEWNKPYYSTIVIISTIFKTKLKNLAITRIDIKTDSDSLFSFPLSKVQVISTFLRQGGKIQPLLRLSSKRLVITGLIKCLKMYKISDKAVSFITKVTENCKVE